ncbi:hypothetical protein M0812_28702 [Anaeramoeba flamelloides]|uniref:Saposin B-type domain-containing protein n=1 Tax=Anaeramoeba flamelloides TaxID=1746091 RepID=A0AAV7YDR8_9EUKA|nr:hypothetical protein M0812_28702 [Anaeramoeba flamelloides]
MKKFTLVAFALFLILLISSVQSSEIECNICLTVVTYLEDFLEEAKTESEIELFLETICSKLGLFKDRCDTIVVEYVPEIIKLLENEEPPKRACEMVHLCSQ